MANFLPVFLSEPIWTRANPYSGEENPIPKRAGGRHYAEAGTKIVDNGDWKAYDVLSEDISLVDYRSQLNRVLAQVFV